MPNVVPRLENYLVRLHRVILRLVPRWARRDAQRVLTIQ